VCVILLYVRECVFVSVVVCGLRLFVCVFGCACL